jgi:hypothetical protein
LFTGSWIFQAVRLELSVVGEAVLGSESSGYALIFLACSLDRSFLSGELSPPLDSSDSCDR